MTTQAHNILAEIKKTVVSIDPGAQVFLFGSRARDDFRPDSDWDILILLNKPRVDYQERKQIRKKLYTIELSAGQPISAFVYSSADWINNQSDTPLFETVKSEGIQL
jgi:predicted nucleotidyltransferase